MLHSKNPIDRRKAIRKVQSCLTVKWPRGFLYFINFYIYGAFDFLCNCVKIGKMSYFQMNPYSKPIFFSNLFPSGI